MNEPITVIANFGGHKFVSPSLTCSECGVGLITDLLGYRGENIPKCKGRPEIGKA